MESYEKTLVLAGGIVYVLYVDWFLTKFKMFPDCLGTVRNESVLLHNVKKLFGITYNSFINNIAALLMAEILEEYAVLSCFY